MISEVFYSFFILSITFLISSVSARSSSGTNHPRMGPLILECRAPSFVYSCIFVDGFSPSQFLLFTTSAHSLGRDERSTFLSPIMIRCKTLPNSRTSAGTLESAAIFCADVKYSSASGRFSLADWIAIKKRRRCPPLKCHEYSMLLHTCGHVIFLRAALDECPIAPASQPRWFSLRQ